MRARLGVPACRITIRSSLSRMSSAVSTPGCPERGEAEDVGAAHADGRRAEGERLEDVGAAAAGAEEDRGVRAVAEERHRHVDAADVDQTPDAELVAA